jgi:hypothetical protein
MNAIFAKQLLALLAMLICCGALSSCQNESDEPSAAQRALDELQSKYDDLIKDKVDVPVDWAAEDLENIGDWEYRVVTLAYRSPEELEAQLNEFGNERWEVIWLEESPGGFLAVLKKPSISYLSKIPISQLGRFVIGEPGAAE